MSDPTHHRPGDYTPQTFPQSGPRVKAYFAMGIEMHEMAGALKDCRRYLTQFGSVDPEALKQQIDDALAMYELREANANDELKQERKAGNRLANGNGN